MVDPDNTKITICSLLFPLIQKKEKQHWSHFPFNSSLSYHQKFVSIIFSKSFQTSPGALPVQIIIKEMALSCNPLYQGPFPNNVYHT